MSNTVLRDMVRRVKHQNEDPLSPLIDEYMMTRDKMPSDRRYWKFPADIEDRYRPGGRLSPSSICGCERLALFKFLGLKGRKIIDPEAERVFDDGKWRHLRLDWQLYDMEAVLGRDKFRVINIEQFVKYPKLMIAGSLDAAVAIYGSPAVIDFKGINSRGFEWLWRRQEPKKAHVRQVITYCRLRNIRRGCLLYECKDDGRYMVFFFEWSKELWAEVTDWAEGVLEDMDRERLPKRDPDCKNGHYMFSKCPYAGLCFGDKTDGQVERLVFKNYDGNRKQLWERGLDEAGQR